MTRPIKFRAWDKTNKKMLYRVIVGNTATDDPCSSVWDEERKEWLIFDQFCGDIMQYTGVKDKNGVEVYEGDVYRFPPVGDSEEVIEYVDDLSAFFESKGLREGEYTWDFSDIEVIGNIYENPELLKKAI